MKKLSTNYEPYKSILEYNGIVAIYYNNNSIWVAELEGSGYLNRCDDMNKELFDDIEKRVARNDGEEMYYREMDMLIENIGYDLTVSV